MGFRQTKDRAIILPWERRGGLLRRLGMSHARPLLLTGLVVLVFFVVAYRERNASAIRASRANLLIVRQGIDAYRADHEGRCPPDLATLEKVKYIAQVPTDAWGSPFILTCPGRFQTEGYELASPGPDGVPGGLDRVE